jgi:phosphatidylcholine synthase
VFILHELAFLHCLPDCFGLKRLRELRRGAPMEDQTQPSISEVVGAAAVHAFTATGAALGLIALLAATEARWAEAFAWLGAALIVDAADGPMARRLEVKRVLPRFSGEDLDNIIDYLTYVTVPAFMVARGPLVPQALALPLAAAIMMTSLYHFADKRSKTADNYFVGFPALWNVVILYCFVLAMPPVLAALLIAACILLTFVPFRFVHPVRVERLRLPTMVIMAAWSAAAIAAVAGGFPAGAAIQAVFALTAVYTVALGLTAPRESPRSNP